MGIMKTHWFDRDRTLMKYEFRINFCKKYRKEILWWLFFIIFSQTFDFKQIAYTRKYYQRHLAKSKEEFTESKEEELWVKIKILVHFTSMI